MRGTYKSTKSPVLFVLIYLCFRSILTSADSLCLLQCQIPTCCILPFKKLIKIQEPNFRSPSTPDNTVLLHVKQNSVKQKEKNKTLQYFVDYKTISVLCNHDGPQKWLIKPMSMLKHSCWVNSVRFNETVWCQEKQTTLLHRLYSLHVIALCSLGG